MIIFLAKLWVKVIKPRWSNLRFIRSIREYQSKSKMIENIEDIWSTLSHFKRNFMFTMDNITMLMDAMNTPPHTLRDLENEELRGDCDDYHAAVYHFFEQKSPFKNIKLITVVTQPLKQSHTMLVFEFNEKLYLVDYTQVIKIQKYEDVMYYMERTRDVNSLFYHLNTWNEKIGWK